MPDDISTVATAYSILCQCMRLAKWRKLIGNPGRCKPLCKVFRFSCYDWYLWSLKCLVELRGVVHNSLTLFISFQSYCFLPITEPYSNTSESRTLFESGVVTLFYALVFLNSSYNLPKFIHQHNSDLYCRWKNGLRILHSFYINNIHFKYSTLVGFCSSF